MQNMRKRIGDPAGAVMVEREEVVMVEGGGFGDLMFTHDSQTTNSRTYPIMEMQQN